MRHARLPLRLVLAAVALVGFAIWPRSAQVQDTPSAATPPSVFEQQRPRFEGVWQRVESGTASRQLVDRAIERTVTAMNFFVRGVARGQLRDNTPINPRITFEFGSRERIAVTFSATNFRMSSRIGRTRPIQRDGDEIRFTQRFRGDVLEQVFETDQGTRWNTYTKTGEDTFRLDAVTQGMMMPSAMRYSLNYRRRP